MDQTRGGVGFAAGMIFIGMFILGFAPLWLGLTLGLLLILVGLFAGFCIAIETRLQNHEWDEKRKRAADREVILAAKFFRD